MAVVSNPQSLLSITGINVFVGDMIRHVTTIDDQLDKVAKTFAERVARDARKYAPVDTGALRDSITVRKVGKATYAISPHTRYSHLIEYGIPSRGIGPRPFMRRALDRHAARFERACWKLAGPVREPGDFDDIEGAA